MQISLLDVGGQKVRVGIRRGERPPLLVFNGIGASIELIEPFIDALEGPEVVIFDVPGVGGSPTPRLPYRQWTLARLSARLLDQLGYEQVDVLGVSWGGALAQQFAFQHAQRCRLVSAPVHVGAALQRELYAQVPTVILTSATLSAGRGCHCNASANRLSRVSALPLIRP